MDIGDWQELARLRAENHLWHRCIAEILDALQPAPGAAHTATLQEAVERSVSELNDRLRRIGRRAVSAAR